MNKKNGLSLKALLQAVTQNSIPIARVEQKMTMPYTVRTYHDGLEIQTKPHLNPIPGSLHQKNLWILK
jgi:hypothetical protein